jgi:hypothetical protein
MRVQVEDSTAYPEEFRREAEPRSGSDGSFVRILGRSRLLASA